MAKSDDAANTEQAAEPEVDIADKTLRQRMALIRADSFGVGKDDIKMSYTDKKTGQRREATIKGHTIEAVLSQMRPLLTEYGVGFTPSLHGVSYNGNRCDVIVDYTFYSLEDEADSLTIRWGGSGTDQGDKAFAKAGTNSLKEVIKKTFLVTDRDDAKEETENIEHRAEGEASSSELEQEREKSRVAQEQWARAMKLAFEKADNLDDVKRLKRDNKDQIDKLPSATQEFFADLIKKRESELEEPKDEKSTTDKKIKAFLSSANKFLDGNPTGKDLLEWEDKNGDKLKWLRENGGDEVKALLKRIEDTYEKEKNAASD